MVHMLCMMHVDTMPKHYLLRLDVALPKSCFNNSIFSLSSSLIISLLL